MDALPTKARDGYLIAVLCTESARQRAAWGPAGRYLTGMNNHRATADWSLLVWQRSLTLGAEEHERRKKFPQWAVQQLASTRDSYDAQLAPYVDAFVAEVAQAGKLALARRASVSVEHVEQVISGSAHPDPRLIGMLSMGAN